MSDLSSTQLLKPAWTPDLFGPIFKKNSITFREALNIHRNDECTRLMATFVPDELIVEMNVTKKNFHRFNAVMMLIDVSSWFGLYDKYSGAENGGSFALFERLKKYINITIEKIYSNEGDILKFSPEGLLAMWKAPADKYIFKIVHNVILCGQRIQEAIAAIEDEVPPEGASVDATATVEIMISAGEVVLSVIGSEAARHLAIAGTPITELKYAQRVSLPGDLVLSSGAWLHCSPSHYEYVIKDSNNVKIIKVVGEPREPSDIRRAGTIDSRGLTSFINPVQESTSDDILHSMSPDFSQTSSLIITDQSSAAEAIATRSSILGAMKRQLGIKLRSYLMKPVLRQIDKDESFQHLIEQRRLTIISINVIPSKSSVHELISLVDKAFLISQSIAGKFSGCIVLLNLYEKDILFSIAFGLRGYVLENQDNVNISKNGILSALEIMRAMKNLAGVKGVSIGVSTDMAYCGVVGHPARRQYMVFGAPYDRSIGIMQLSYDKVSCDYDTIFYSLMKKKHFLSRGTKPLTNVGKYHVYEIVNDSTKAEDREKRAKFNYCYPILGRFEELEYFKDVLDEIGVGGRSYAGLLIEGPERSGKSRLLDAFATIVRNRQIKLIAIPLHPSYAEKAYAVLYCFILQLFDAEDCKTVDDRERILLRKLGDVIPLKDFCYLNVIARVHFKLSKEYCLDTDWKRHEKTMKIFEVILRQIDGKICILLDDVQHMDVMSWQFLSIALNNENVVLVAALLEPVSWDDLSQVEADICSEKRLMKRTLIGLESKFLAAFACQFLNVIAIPRSFEKILKKHSNNEIRWCEAFLMSALQTECLKFIIITPNSVDLYDLTFPESTLLTKIPFDLTPEEVAPPLHWSQMSSLNICLMSEKHNKLLDPRRDVVGLRNDIYDRMRPYQQYMIKCAAILGLVFLRSLLEDIMTNTAPLYTAKAVAEMIRIRVLRCSMIQRKEFYTEGLPYFALKMRRTFSDMHHLVACDCRQSRIYIGRALPIYAHCTFLEFSIPSYRRMFYNILTPEQKKKYHSKAASNLEKVANKCSGCGGGSFLSIPSTEESRTSEAIPEPVTIKRRTPVQSQTDRLEMSRHSIFAIKNSNMDKRRQSVNVRRISILPVHGDDSETNGALAIHSEGSTTEGSLFDSSKRLRLPTIPEAAEPESHETELREFSHVDYRSCRCIDIIGCLFWNLHYHIEKSGEIDKMVKFKTEYGAGLIKTGQETFAIKFLATRKESGGTNEMKEMFTMAADDAIVTEGIVLVLMGDAYMALGNYSRAKKIYAEAANLRIAPLKSNRAICYNAMLEKLRRKLRCFPDYVHNRVSGQMAVIKLEIASYLRRLATVLMIQGKPKIANLTILQGIRSGFGCLGGFQEKAEVYLDAVDIFRRLGDMDLVQSLEKPMTAIIREKVAWNSVEEMSILAHVFLKIYENRALRGDLEDAIEIGNKVLKVCNCLHITRIKLGILPSLIEIMVWTKRTNESVDLMKQLYFSSEEDVDKSALTWYYALSLELLLDAGMILETYQTCYDHFQKIIVHQSKACVSRDPESLSRLATCICIWQLRMTTMISETFVQRVTVYTSNLRHDNFSRILNCCKGLECYLLILLQRVNIRKSSDLMDKLQDVDTIMKFLDSVSHSARFVNPLFHLLQSYMNILRGRTFASQISIQKSQRCSATQGNKLMLAWIMQNKRTWKEANYNNMAHYWVEHVGSADGVPWQDLHDLDLEAWSTILFPLPLPDSYL